MSSRHGFVANQVAILLGCGEVPGRGQRDGSGKGGGPSLVDGGVAHVDAGGAIGHRQCRNAQVRYRRIVEAVRTILAVNQGDLLG